MNDFKQEDVRLFWNSVAHKYEQTNATVKIIHNQRFKQATSYKLNYKPKKILNVWSRTGEALPFFKKRFQEAEIFNLELSEKMMDIFKYKFPNENINKLDFDNLPFPDEYFDLVISLETLEHAPDPEAFLKEIFRVLKPNCNLIMSCPSAFSEFILRLYEIFFDNHGEGPHRFLSSGEVKMKLSKTGFNLIEHRGFIMFPIIGTITERINQIVEGVFNRIGLSDVGIRQFYFTSKINE